MFLLHSRTELRSERTTLIFLPRPGIPTFSTTVDAVSRFSCPLRKTQQVMFLNLMATRLTDFPFHLLMQLTLG
ncbi:hypothetical protein SG26_08020 [Haloarcula sp. CBA1115]|nr:hypothetical protein SG26_08020 [Haloarcula sp. CBA1115]